MLSTHKLAVALSLVAVSVPAAARAETADVQPVLAEQEEPKNSINISPLGALVGNYALTYERLFGGSHGLVVEGIGGFASNDSSSASQLGGAVGYRWHWSGRQNSGFLGVMVAQGIGSGEVTITENGQSMTHAMSVRSTTVTGNVGKRWMIGPANVTLRVGLGWGNYTAKVKSDAPGAQDAEKLMNDLLAFLPIGFDGELSVGYTF